jgi:hypothetical protein
LASPHGVKSYSAAGFGVQGRRQAKRLRSCQSNRSSTRARGAQRNQKAKRSARKT